MPAEMDFPIINGRLNNPAKPVGWRTVRVGNSHWDIQSRAASWLDERGELPVPLWLKTGQAEIVKTGPHRTVYRLNVPDGKYYLKHFRSPDWQAVLQNVVRPCKADLEWRAARTVSDAGINTFETIAVGRHRKLGVIRDCFLISREIEGTQPLDDFVLQTFPNMDGDQQQFARRSIAVQLGAITARLHRCGLLHRDYHPGNILIRKRGQSWELYLIDLHALSRKRAFSLEKIAANVALLNNFFGRFTTRADRQRFFQSYQDAWRAEGSDPLPLPRETASFIEGVCRNELELGDVRGDKKWKRGNRRLLILESSQNRCRGLAGLGMSQLSQIRDCPERLFDPPLFVAWRKGHSHIQQGIVELELEGKPQRGIVSATTSSGFSVRQAWEMGHAVFRRRLPIPRPLLFVETERGQQDYLVIEHIPDAVGLRNWISQSSNKYQTWRDLVSLVARQLTRLHALGFVQTNLTLSSLLIQKNTTGLKVWFVSLESLKQSPQLNAGDSIRSLARLLDDARRAGGVSPIVCLRFLRSFLGSNFKATWKRYWREIESDANLSNPQEAA